ncbi:hypothetical protein [Pelagibacterium luteolum]|uniref:Uncharacterized protein n=1 Tax=Pelagibacterium luteolum TaxID=440168 RepID=A0A1G8AKD5_9HYPH|nr:hypothetical protein [Pelagibacterium luteolum]SDH21319.1 hypothetical protein SAMN04487974_1323 [Pelagibacterium luteolum]
MRCYRDRDGINGPLEALYFARDWERLPRAMREAGLFQEISSENWDLHSVAKAVETSGWTVRFRCQMPHLRAVAAE